MRNQLLYFAPAVVALLWWLFVWRRVPHWRDSRFVRNPERALWGVWHFLDTREWTEEGLRIRRLHILNMIAVAVLAIATALLLDLR